MSAWRGRLLSQVTADVVHSFVLNTHPKQRDRAQGARWAKHHNSLTRARVRAAEYTSQEQVLCTWQQDQSLGKTEVKAEVKAAWRVEMQCSTVLSPHATTKFTAQGRRKTEVKFVKEALQQPLASHAHIHDPDTHRCRLFRYNFF
jgi:hypothetical protein